MTVQQHKRIYFQSHPKTGNTWARLLLGRYFQTIGNLPDTILLEGHSDENKGLLSRNLPEFFSSHAPLTWQTQTAGDLTHENVVEPYHDGAVILMVRYPLDAVLSHYMQHHFGRGHERRRKFKSFFEFASHPVFGVEKAIRFYNIWAETIGRGPIFPLKYEVLRQQTLETARSLLDFMGIRCDEPALRQAIDESSFESMRSMEIRGDVPRYRSSNFVIFSTGDLAEPNSYFVRQGRFREYREHLTEPQVYALEKLIYEQLSPTYGYQADAS